MHTEEMRDESVFRCIIMAMVLLRVLLSMVERSASVPVYGIRTVEFYKLTRMRSVCMYMHIGYNNDYHRGQE